jgi:uncharacterized lipoprotein YmbA
MMRGPSARLIVLALASLCVAACIRPQQNPWRFYTLSALPRAEQTVTNGSTGQLPRAIGVGPIHLPEYLDQDEIVHRISQNRLALSDNDRWAEPLADNVANVLAENLSMLLQTVDVTVRRWPDPQRPSHQLEIEVLRFEADTTGTAHLDARYFLRDVASGQTIATKEARLTATATDHSTEQSVALLSKALGDFSVGIADVIREYVKVSVPVANDTLRRAATRGQANTQ